MTTFVEPVRPQGRLDRRRQDRCDVVALDTPEAADQSLTGAKAAALARARAAGLPTLPGLVLTTHFCEAIDEGAIVVRAHPAARVAFERAGGEAGPLVVRSSSPSEDQVGSSMAGQFESVIGTHGIDEFEAAVQVVLDSRVRLGAARGLEPMAVLVQPLLEPALAGVMFGIEPVTGRSDRRVVTAVAGAPSSLVSGETNGSRHVLDPRGRVVETDVADGPTVPKPALRQLMELSDRAASLFGGPQDLEWAIDGDGTPWLLQARPITTEDRGVPSGPVYGPGPVAETFPEALTRLEQDLWVPPLREGVRNAVVLAGTATKADLARTEVVVSIEGRVAIDLRLAGEIHSSSRLVSRLNPIPAARRLRGAWRVGRLRAALPVLAEQLLDRADADLETVPPLETLTSRQLLALLYRGQGVLRSLHAHEILMGLLTEAGCGRLTGASVALRVLSEARRDGLDDATIRQGSPVVLALTAPAVRPMTDLPVVSPPPDLGQSCNPGSDSGVLREALRLRTRWIQELMGLGAWQLGERLAESGDLPTASAIRHVPLDDLEAVVTRRASALTARMAEQRPPAGDPLPSRFRVSDRGRPIPSRRSEETGGGTAAGGGVGTGPVTFDTTDPPAGTVLVTNTLSPGLGPVLPRLAGLVSDTGSVLSHLAILAREFGVPTVVAYPGATSTFAEHQIITVDGDRGDVTIQGADS